MNSEEAWSLYKERGVIAPGFGGEISERLARKREWEAAGVEMA